MSQRTPDNPIPQIITTEYGTYEWHHSMDYAKNGVLHYYKVDEDGHTITGRGGSAMFWVTHSNGHWESRGLHTDEFIAFMQGYVKGREMPDE